MYKIAIIGAGQLGSRHLQALAKVEEELSISVADISSAALETARSRFEEIEGHAGKQVAYITSLEALPPALDLVIIATNSLNRLEIIRTVLACTKAKYWILEKFLFPRMSDYTAMESLIETHGLDHVWVNCPRRTSDLYQSIRGQIKGPIDMSVAGSNWGLGCNGIHFLDLFAMLTGSSQVRCVDNGMDGKVQVSKRAGYVEFTGRLSIVSDQGDSFTCTSYEDGNHPIMLRVASKDHEWAINEARKEVIHYAAADNWNAQAGTFQLLPQSVTGTAVVTDILRNGRCDLTPYRESAQLHQVLLPVYLQHYQQYENTNNDLCPIT